MGFPASLAPVKYPRGGGLVSGKKQLQRSRQCFENKALPFPFVLVSPSRMSAVLLVREGRRHKYKHFYYSVWTRGFNPRKPSFEAFLLLDLGGGGR